jgi:hypothetical protein
MVFSLQCERETACGNMLQIKKETSDTAGRKISKIKRETLKICEIYKYKYVHKETKTKEIEEETKEIEKKEEDKNYIDMYCTYCSYFERCLIVQPSPLIFCVMHCGAFLIFKACFVSLSQFSICVNICF